MNGSPLVSVIVRSMARPSLQAALASIAAQDYPAAEVVVVAACGASHPPLPETCGAYPLRRVASGSRLPRPAAANAGLDQARGEWVTLLDDDDVFLAGHLSALMTAAEQAAPAKVVHSYACAVFADGRRELIGQPHALVQLYERNYISLSTAVFARELAVAGCRFDESFDILEDWDFVLQLAQRTPFHFVPLHTFEYHVEAGDSGLGKGGNQDTGRYAAFRDRIHAKWASVRDDLLNRAAPHLQRARAFANERRWEEAEESCRAALAQSPNDPRALNLLAMVMHGRKQIAAARAMQELALAVRPLDAGLAYDLAVLYATPLSAAQGEGEAGMLGELAARARRQDDLNHARRCCERALALEPGFLPAQRLLAELTSAGRAR